MLFFKLILGILFGLLVSAVTILGIVSYQNNIASLETADLVRHSHEVLDQTDKISSIYKDIQLESVAFFINKDSSLLGPYLEARQNLHQSITDLRRLTAGNQRQQPEIDTLQLLVDQLIGFSNDALNSDKQYLPGEVNRRVKQGVNYRERIRKVIGAVKADENELLIQRQQNHTQSINAFNKTFFFLLSAIAVLLVTTFFAVRYNFNKRIEAEEEQKKANELFVKLFYESPMGIVISRLETGEIIDCNKAYSEMMNYGKSELIGKTAVQLQILQSTSQRNQIIRGTESSGVQKDLEVQLKPKGKDAIWTSISTQPIEINGEMCLLSAILDTTVHKEAEEKIKEALTSEIELNKLKSNFIALASHEFRTPLTTILSSAFLLERFSAGENSDKVAKHLSRIKGSVNLLISILDEFLSLTRIEEGKIEARNEKLNLKEVLDTVCQNLKGATRQGQKIVYTHTGDDEIYSDPVLLGHIVNNLVSNAIKYSGENSEIWVRSSVNSQVHLSVKDFGIGISNEDQGHLFERFFRASNTGNIQGTGLGLHILKHYLDVLKGSITVESEPGKGSEFKITFDI